jgi:hypothetical protein
MAAMPWRFGQELVDTCGFAAGYKSVNRFVGKLRGQGITGSLRGDRDRTRRRAAGGFTAQARWCATRTLASTVAHGCSC